MAEPAVGTGVRRWWHSRFGASFARELFFITALLLFYKYGRSLVSGESTKAIDHAREVIAMERDLRIFTEERLQAVVIGTGDTIEWLLNSYYLLAHVVVTAAVFFWLYVRHPNTYVRFRWVMIAMTLAGLVVHVLYPLAPPRMFPHLGFVDTGRAVGPASYGHGSAYSGFANQFAAMPSLHFGWALAVAWSVTIATRRRVRWLIVLHPFLTLAAIVLTANHYWLDAIAATALFAGALFLDHWRVKRARPSSPASPEGSAWSRESRGSLIHT
jgi:hypothetical protein